MVHCINSHHTFLEALASIFKSSHHPENLLRVVNYIVILFPCPLLSIYMQTFPPPMRNFKCSLRQSTNTQMVWLQ